MNPNYRREFLRSPWHAALGVLTLGLGFMSASTLGLIAGGTAYALGLLHLPDLAFFRRWVDRRYEAARLADEAQRLADFVRRRDTLLGSLPPQSRERYHVLAAVCRDIETASADSPLTADPTTDPRLRKLDELMWTYLRLLGIEASLEQFLETERRDDVPNMLNEAEAEVARLSGELDDLKAKGDGAGLEARRRLVSSRLERLEVLRKRQQRIAQTRENLTLVLSEQDRLDQQIKLVRADAIATKNADALSARIDATVEHLDQTNKWLSELDEFKDLVADMPNTERRVGYAAASTPPPLVGAGQRPPPLQSGRRLGTSRNN